MAYLDETGLSRVWSKVKSLVNSAKNEVIGLAEAYTDTVCKNIKLVKITNDETGMSIGKSAELSNTFDVGLETKFRQGVNVGNNVRLVSSSEGGNFQVISPNGVVWEMDAYNDNLRIFSLKNGVYKFPIVLNCETGSVEFNNAVGIGGDLYANAGFCLNGNWQTDTVVAQGTSGVWQYRKWASGFAECWCAKTVSATGNGYSLSALSASLNLAFPFTFTSTPLLTYNSIGQSNVNHLVGNISYNKTTVASVTLHPAAGNTTAFSGNLVIHAFGKWK